ncbi:MAG: hypothetical protein HY909_13315, partial [Deltaproteobacteria bacterium]|nr:hypothetical protein [Deltaproteobacteria bacterium]
MHLLRAAAVAFALSACPGASTPPSGGDASMDTTPTCTSAQLLCGATCASVMTDSLNCGACGRRCADSERCMAGACQTVCPAGQQACTSGADGGQGGAVCALLSTDRNHCGTCGRRCGPGEVCSTGACQTSCAMGLETCAAMDGTRACANVSLDPRNCGRCGNVCSPGETCDMGMCRTSCPAGQTACAPSGMDGGAGFCANLQEDRNNCGACGTACMAGQV